MSILKSVIKSRQSYTYPIERSPLYQLKSKKKLAELLGVEVASIRDLDKSGLDKQYHFFRHKKIERFVTEPAETLAKIHKRLLKLFMRIEVPSYLHSAKKRHSYKTNAEAHRDSCSVIKVDIKKFFPSIKFERVYQFFSASLQCSPDISTILTRLCVVQPRHYRAHLPTGSCISPILSFLVNKTMFDNINRLSDEHGCTFTLYVDDITISGPSADSCLLDLVIKEILKMGYDYHKTNISKRNYVLITGLMVNNGKVFLPHSRIVKINRNRKQLDVAVPNEQAKLLASLVGRLSEAEQIEPRYKLLKSKILCKYDVLWRLVVADRLNSQIHRKRR